MTVTEMHIEIEQGLQQSGRFANRKLDPDEYDVAINAETVLLMDNVFKEREAQPSATFEGNMFTAQITANYKKESVLSPVSSVQYADVTLPNTLHMLINHVVGYWVEGDITDKVLPNKTYRCEGNVRYDETWYKDGDYFTTGTIVLFFYGSVTEVGLRYYPTRLLGSERIHDFKESYYHRTKRNNPVTELLNRTTLRVYQKDFVVNKVKAQYSILPATVNYRESKHSDLPENVQHWLVNKVIARILSNNNQSQQQIANLKTEVLQ